MYEVQGCISLFLTIKWNKFKLNSSQMGYLEHSFSAYSPMISKWYLGFIVERNEMSTIPKLIPISRHSTGVVLLHCRDRILNAHKVY